MNLEVKKKEIAERMHKGETPRGKQIRDNNARYAMQGNAIKAKDRHERRHGGKKGTSLNQRKEFINSMHSSHGRGYGD